MPRMRTEVIEIKVRLERARQGTVDAVKRTSILSNARNKVLTK